MFYFNNAFNQPIGNWDVSNVKITSRMFAESTSFNQPLGNWDVSNVVTMSHMFNTASSFNQDINSWDTSSAANMVHMFQNATSFNQSISNWDVSNVYYMAAMFQGAIQNLTGWCVSNFGSEPTSFATNSALTNSNKPIWGKEFTISLTNGSQSQTVTATNAITPIQYTVTSICNSATSVNASNLPTGVTATLNNNIIGISGTPTAQSSGTYNYSLTVSGTTKSSIVTGTIIVNSAPRTYIPDNVFEQKLINLGYDDVLDDYVLTSNISGITSIDLQRTGAGTPNVMEIKDITGIEDFISLVSLNLINNGITSSIDLSKMTNLNTFSASSNLFPSIDVSNNPNLTDLRIQSGPLSSIDVSNNPNLSTLMVGSTNLNSLNISNNNQLRVLSISTTSITTVDVSSKSALEELYAHYANLSSLDVSNNSNLNRCYIQGNPNLICAQVSQSQLDNLPNGFTKDNSQCFSTDCSNGNLGLRVEVQQGGNVQVQSRVTLMEDRQIQQMVFTTQVKKCL